MKIFEIYKKFFVILKNKIQYSFIEQKIRRHKIDDEKSNTF